VRVVRQRLTGVVEDLVSDLISRGVEKIASRKNLTSQDLTVLLLHEQSRSVSRMEKGIERLEKGMDGIVGELREFRREAIPLLNLGRDMADIRARLERIEAKLN